ncbi:MAG: terminase TerL endonuclease subunit, partial [Bauldia sp.]
ILNDRPEAEFVIIAPTIKVANHSFAQAENTIRLDDELEKLFHIRPHLRRIEHLISGASLSILAADTDIVTGGKQLGTLIDETHVFGTKSKAADILLELRGALAARPDGFLFQITTQSKAPPAGVFKAELEMARAVRDGKVRLPLLAVLYEHPDELLEKDRWQERRYWQIVNPNLGLSVDPAFLELQLMKATRQGAAEMALIASQHFNVQIGVRLGADRWRGAEHWEAAADTTLTLDELLARSEVAIVGIDGGGLDDLLGVAVIGREIGTRNWLLWGKGWCQADVLKIRQEIAPALLGFEQDGDLTIIGEHQLADGTTSWGVADDDPDPLTSDIRGVADIVQQVFDAGLLPAEGGVGFDPQGVGAMVDELARRNITAPCVVSVPQGFRLSSAVWSMERKLKDGTLRHAGQGLMNFCVGNAKVELKGNAVLITKEAAGRAKIDVLIAAFNAAKLMERNPEAAAGVDLDAYLRTVRMIA